MEEDLNHQVLSADWPTQQHPHTLERLTLRLGDGCSKYRPDRELVALPLKLVLLWLQNTGVVGIEEHPVGPHNPELCLLFADRFIENQAVPLQRP